MLNEELKIYFRRILPLLILVLGLPLISFLIWLTSPDKNLEIVIVNKTVPNEEFREHQALFWSLNHLKYQTNDGNYYEKESDYFGFHPDKTDKRGISHDFENLSKAEIKEKAAKSDVIFFVDSYGVFEDDFSEIGTGEPSKKIYGGLSENDLALFREASNQDKTIIAEFNTMASPTSKQNRTEFENLFGIKWTGWIARYYEEMDSTSGSDIPVWFVRNYLKQHDSTWVNPGPGMAFVHEDGRVEALEFGADYQHQIPQIRTQLINKHGFNLPEVVPYPDWFDIVLIQRDYQVISYYDLDPTNEGSQKLREMGLPRFFPAAVSKITDKGDFYYLAGDFSDQNSELGSPHFAGLPYLWSGFHLVTNYKDRESFFWNYYHPLMKQILRKSYGQKEE